MKCSRCAAEIPGQAQFCMKCGTPVAFARPGGAATISRPLGATGSNVGTKKGLIAGAAALLALLALGGFIGLRALTNRNGTVPNGGRVVDAPGVTPTGGPLTERNGRIGSGGPLTNATSKNTPSPPDPQDVIDYLAFLKDIERQRVVLVKRQTGEILELTASVQGGNILSQMNEDEAKISKAENDTYQGIQKKLAEWPKQWDELSRQFLSKQAPQSCVLLRDKYYDVLGKTNSSIVAVGSSVSSALGGDPSKALNTLSQMQGSGMGSASKSVDDSCASADKELANVCDKFRIHKDFDILPDGGSGNLFGGLSGIH